MKFNIAFIAIILSIVLQVSFIRLFGSFSFLPNIFVATLFLLCYMLSFERILVLAIFSGLSVDLVSSVSFGSTLIAAFGACSISFYLRKSILKGGRLADFLLNCLIAFIVFYCLLSISNILMRTSAGNVVITNLLNVNILGEIFFDLVFSVFGYYLIGYYDRNKIYGFIQNIKISS